MNKTLEGIYKTQTVFGKSIYPMSMHMRDCLRIEEFIEKYNLKNTLEIGVGYGISTLHIANKHKELKRGHHTAIDPYANKCFHGIATKLLKEVKGWISLLEIQSYYYLPSIETKFDMVLIDSSHSLPETWVEFFYSDKILLSGGFMIFHDTHMDGVRPVIEYLYNNPRYMHYKSNEDAVIMEIFKKI